MARLGKTFKIPGIRKGRGKLAGLLAALILAVVGYWGLQGRVISVADGDTMTVMTQKGAREKVRLYGIDCPESGQSFGDDAAAFTSSLVLWSEVELLEQNRDQYGRSVCVVMLADGRSLNETLLSEGLAMVYDQYCKTPRCVEYRRLESEARGLKKGIWRAKSPLPPWEWRVRHKKGRRR